jgi:hypothetical protein
MYEKPIHLIEMESEITSPKKPINKDTDRAGIINFL